MTKKRLNKAVNRGFHLAGNVLMRRAIARLIHIDDASLSHSGLTRAAITDFLTTPLHTDPHRFFRHRRVQDAATPPVIKPDADGSIKDMNGQPAHLFPTKSSIKPTMALRIRVLTASALIGLGALTACSGSVFEPDAAAARREQPARCRLKPERQLIIAHAPRGQDHTTSWGVVLNDAPHLQHQRHARDGPAADAV